MEFVLSGLEMNATQKIHYRACMYICAEKSMNNIFLRERGGRISDILMNIIIRGDGRQMREPQRGVGTVCWFGLKDKVYIGKDGSTSASCKQQ